MKPSPSSYNFGAADYKQTVKTQVDKWLRDKATDSLNCSQKLYREWYYDGVEVVDNPDDGPTCRDPIAVDCSDTSETVPAAGRDSYPPQKYYLKGLESGNFNCRRYLVTRDPNAPDEPMSPERVQDFRDAFECCNKRNRDYICIDAGDDDDEKVFCEGNGNCTINSITYSTDFEDGGRLICAESYSLCPYNFSIGGGSQFCDYYQDGTWNEGSGKWDMITLEEVESGSCTSSAIREQGCGYNAKAGKCRNYCQILTHCTTTSRVTPYASSITSPYFSEACLNFVGDSQNKAGFGGDVLIGNQKHFSTPIAQCVKETLENVFYNRAGHSKCSNFDEIPSSDGTCLTGSYITDGTFVFKKGNQVQEQSFFENMQNILQKIVKLVITLSIMLYGMNILTGKSDIRNKKDILVYIFKIAVVLYFATGDAWQSIFFDGVYGASSELSRMVFKIQSSEDENKRDGCQFGDVYDEKGAVISTNTYYPPGKQYLALWDTLDCKMMRYLGFGPQASAANIVMLILAAFLTGPYGIYFAFSVMIFGVLLLSAVIRALHIFLSSAISIIIMVFVSPIIIPLILFEKTKSIFDQWLKELISFAIQPMILFAYLAIFIMTIDKTLVGDATFEGASPAKTMNCEERCININTLATVSYDGTTPPACDEKDEKIIDPYNSSVACLISIDNFGTFPGLEIFGIALPIIPELLEGDVKAKILTILRGVLVMFLIYSFMDEIPGITQALTGGTNLPGSSSNGLAMFKGLLNRSREVQKRLARGSLRATKNLASSARKGVGKAAASRKGGGDAPKDRGADHVGNNGGSGTDSAGGTKPKADLAGNGGGKGNDSSDA
jgi:type IV secretory pathway VirB6-like protein